MRIPVVTSRLVLHIISDQDSFMQHYTIPQSSITFVTYAESQVVGQRGVPHRLPLQSYMCVSSCYVNRRAFPAAMPTSWQAYYLSFVLLYGWVTKSNVSAENLSHNHGLVHVAMHVAPSRGSRPNPMITAWLLTLRRLTMTRPLSHFLLFRGFIRGVKPMLSRSYELPACFLHYPSLQSPAFIISNK